MMRLFCFIGIIIGWVMIARNIEKRQVSTYCAAVQQQYNEHWMLTRFQQPIDRRDLASTALVSKHSPIGFSPRLAIVTRKKTLFFRQSLPDPSGLG